MKGVIVGFLLVAACSSAMADDEWVVTAGNDDVGVVESMKKGSGEITKNKGGEDIYAVVGRVYNTKTKGIDLVKWYVKLSDCINKQGKLVTLSLGGDYLYENDFIFNGGSIASSNAEFICSVYEYHLNEINKKGI